MYFTTAKFSPAPLPSPQPCAARRQITPLFPPFFFFFFFSPSSPPFFFPRLHFHQPSLSLFPPLPFPRGNSSPPFSGGKHFVLPFISPSGFLETSPEDHPLPVFATPPPPLLTPFHPLSIQISSDFPFLHPVLLPAKSFFQVPSPPPPLVPPPPPKIKNSSLVLFLSLFFRPKNSLPPSSPHSLGLARKAYQGNSFPVFNSASWRFEPLVFSMTFPFIWE